MDQVGELRALLNEAKEREVLLLEAYEQLERWVAVGRGVCVGGGGARCGFYEGQ